MPETLIPEPRFFVYQGVITAYDEDKSDYFVYTDTGLYANCDDAVSALTKLDRPTHLHEDDWAEEVAVIAVY